MDVIFVSHKQLPVLAEARKCYRNSKGVCPATRSAGSCRGSCCRMNFARFLNMFELSTSFLVAA